MVLLINALVELLPFFRYSFFRLFGEILAIKLMFTSKHFLLSLTLLLILCSIYEVRADEDFGKMSVEELQTKLSELYNGKVDLSKYTEKDKIINAIQLKQEKLQEQNIFEEKVAISAKKRENSFKDFPHEVHLIADPSKMKIYREYQKEFEEKLPNFEDFEFTSETYKSDSKFETVTMFRILGFSLIFLSLAKNYLPFPAGVKNFITTYNRFFLTTALFLTTMNQPHKHAFEVMLDGRIIFSGLENRRLPLFSELRKMLLEETLLHDYV